MRKVYTLSVESFPVITLPFRAREARVLTGELLTGKLLAGKFSTADEFL